MKEIDIPVPEQLPTRISPCPIVEAILEIRFVTEKGWTVLPGLLHQHIRERYSEPTDLPLAAIPDEVRRGEESLTYRPLAGFEGDGFQIRFGPRVLSLIVSSEYPGWSAVDSELGWILERVAEAGFIVEGERLGMRYIDFFEGDLFPHLVIQPRCDGAPLEGIESTLTLAFEREDFRSRLILSNSVSVDDDEVPRSGSVFDLDLSVGPSDFELFENGRNKFHDAHRLNKEIFFGSLKPEFLSTLSPEYD